MHLFFGNRQMFDSPGNNHKFALFQVNITVPQFDEQSSFYDEEQFVLLFMPVPDELTFQLYQFDVGVIEFAYNLRTPVLLKKSELLAEVYLSIVCSSVILQVCLRIMPLFSHNASSPP